MVIAHSDRDHIGTYDLENGIVIASTFRASRASRSWIIGISSPDCQSASRLKRQEGC